MVLISNAQALLFVISLSSAAMFSVDVYTYVTITLCSISSLSVLALVLSVWQWCLGGSAWPSPVLCLAGSPSTLPALSLVQCPLRQYKEEFLCFCWAGKDNRAMSWSSLHPWVGESLMECGWLSQLVSCSIYSRIDRLLVCRCVSVSSVTTTLAVCTPSKC